MEETCSTRGGEKARNIVEKLSRPSLKLFRPEFPKYTWYSSPKCQKRLWSPSASYSVGTRSKATGDWSWPLTYIYRRGEEQIVWLCVLLFPWYQMSIVPACYVCDMRATETRWSEADISSLCDGSGFKSQPVDRVYWAWFIVVFLGPLGEYRIGTLIYASATSSNWLKMCHSLVFLW